MPATLTNLEEREKSGKRENAVVQRLRCPSSIDLYSVCFISDGGFRELSLYSSLHSNSPNSNNLLIFFLKKLKQTEKTETNFSLHSLPGNHLLLSWKGTKRKNPPNPPFICTFRFSQPSNSSSFIGLRFVFLFFLFFIFPKQKQMFWKTISSPCGSFSRTPS